MATITVKFKGTCRDCGATLYVGQQARWYGKGKIYCVGEHKNEMSDQITDGQGRIGWVATMASGDEVFQNYNGRCIDAPCCGCCS
jgi:hypothetical protein